jgi:hypothetical protein
MTEFFDELFVPPFAAARNSGGQLFQKRSMTIVSMELALFQ